MGITFSLTTPILYHIQLSEVNGVCKKNLKYFLVEKSPVLGIKSRKLGITNGLVERTQQPNFRQMLFNVHQGSVSYTLLICSLSLPMPNSILEIRQVQNLSGSGSDPITLYLYQAITSSGPKLSSNMSPRFLSGGIAVVEPPRQQYSHCASVGRSKLMPPSFPEHQYLVLLLLDIPFLLSLAIIKNGSRGLSPRESYLSPFKELTLFSIAVQSEISPIAVS